MRWECRECDKAACQREKGGQWCMMKVLYVLWAILFGMIFGLIALLTIPLLLLYVGVKIIGGFASKLN